MPRTKPELAAYKLKLYHAMTPVQRAALRASKRAWYAKNCERVREQKNAYRRARFASDVAYRLKRQQQRRDYYARHPQECREYARKHLFQKKFGITIEQYDAMLVAQNGVCAICGDPPTTRRLPVDHDHKSGHVRGLLCERCNLGVGYFRDDTTLLMRATAYLARPQL